MSSSPIYQQHMYTRVPYTPISIANFLCLLSAIIDPAERLTQLENYIQVLEHQLRIIHTFTHVPGLIPHSILVLRDVIHKLKDEAANIKVGVNSKRAQVIDLSTSIPEERRLDNRTEIMKENGSGRSMIPVPDFKPCKISIGNGAFKPYKKSCISTGAGAQDQNEENGKSVLSENPIPEPACLRLNMMRWPYRMPAPTAAPVMSERNDEGDIGRRSCNRSKRKIWYPVLHQRFEEVVKAIGGPEAATPKLIKHKMGVEDLTYEQVKSHLQKYRLRTRSSASDEDDNHED